MMLFSTLTQCRTYENFNKRYTNNELEKQKPALDKHLIGLESYLNMSFEPYILLKALECVW